MFIESQMSLIPWYIRIDLIILVQKQAKSNKIAIAKLGHVGLFPVT